MNVTLMASDPVVEFIPFAPDIYKSEDDIKNCYFNNQGSLLAIATKSNLIKIFEFLAKNEICVINYFKENELKITSVSWADNSEYFYVTYENKKLTGYARVNLNLSANESNLFTIKIIQEDFDKSIKDVRLLKITNVSYRAISGSFPCIISEENGNIFNFFQQKYQHAALNIIVRDAVDENSFLLFVKDPFLIFLLKENNETNKTRNEALMSSLSDRNLKETTKKILIELSASLNPALIMVDFLSADISGEMLSVQLNCLKTLILINSSDRVLRLYKYDYDTISLIKEYNDSVNRKRWINAYFYTCKIKNGFEDLIVSALADATSVEFIFIDIETGKFTRRLEPFKYIVSDFICHYMNHFTLVLVSGKKLFSIIGHLINNWGSFAPQLKYAEDIIEYIEDEMFYDCYDSKLKKSTVQCVYGDKFVRNLFENKINKKSNLFFKYVPLQGDSQSVQSENDLKDVFMQVNETAEIVQIN